MPDFDRTMKSKKVVFLDLDGTIYLGNRLIQGATVFLDYLKDHEIHHYFLSNNSSRSKMDYVKKLDSLGIKTTADNIILSTDGVIEFLLDEKAKNVYVIGTKSMKEMFIKAGINVESSNPEYVILGYDTELTYEKIRKAAIFLLNGINLLATHCDIVCPTQDGPIPDVGAMLALFEKATEKKAVKIFGKPNAEMVSHALKKHNASPQEVAMIGDRIYTDMELARRIGCDFILVLSGETKKKDIENLEGLPALIVENIGQII